VAHTIRLTGPVQKATGRERYYTVEIQLSESRLRYVFRFAWVEEDGDERLVVAETAILQDFDDPAGQDVEPVTPPAIRDFLGRWESLERTARAAIVGVNPEQGEAAARPPRTRREMSPEFLADIVRRHGELRAAGTAPTEALAREEGVGPSTVRHWLRKAREIGVER
jgi:hypothetical protein